MFKVNNKITRTTSHVNDVVLVFLLLTLNIFTPFSSISMVDFEQVIVSSVAAALLVLHEFFNFSNSMSKCVVSSICMHHC